jgi:hypothetical protein
VYSYASRLDKLLDRELLVIGDFILTEVLQGFAEIAIQSPGAAGLGVTVRKTIDTVIATGVSSAAATCCTATGI